jgi:glycosyltransferase involved in cell wall biosynthesis
MQDPEAFTGSFLWLYRRVFPHVYNQRADLVKCIAEESRQDLIRNFGIRADHTRLIYNPVDFDEVRQLGRAAAEHPWFEDEERAKIPVIVNVGRLCGQKRQDLLLQAFAIVRKTRHARLALIGRGEHQARLQSLADTLGIRDDVVFLGFQRNPWRFIARGALLALASDWEGLPCVITEAMALSTPVVSTRCPSGPTEMLLGGDAGVLSKVGDPDDLARAILETLEDPVATRRRTAIATEHLQRFDPERVTRSYEALADELTAIGRERRGALA